MTETHLFPTALRSTAIVISPRGFAEDARDAARGELRNAGKLMLDLDAERLCAMLEAKDRAASPGIEMETLLDSFLLSLGR